MTKSTYQLGDVIGHWEVCGLMNQNGLIVYYLYHRTNKNRITCDEDTLTRIFPVINHQLIDTNG
ncbi:MAG: hypothetical protein AAF652_13600 [Cyanobacteria bacterium P01_C01_bin.72]